MTLARRTGLAKYLHDARTFPREALGAWRRDGLGGAWVELRERTLQRLFLYWRADVLQRDLAGVPPLPTPEGVSVTRFEGSDWSVLAPIANERTIAGFHRIAVRPGRCCFVAWRDGRPIGYNWMSTAIDPDLETYPIPLPPDAVYVWHVFVARAERRRGVAKAMGHVAVLHARALGYRSGWGLIEHGNDASLAGYQKIGGARIVGTLTYRKLLSRVWMHYEPRTAPAP